jgi:hypothetical protein
MNLRQSVDARLLVEVCLLRSLRPPAADGESAGIAALALRVAALERGAVPTPASSPAAPNPATPPSAAARPAPSRGIEDGANAVVEAAPEPVLPNDLVVEAIGRRDLTTLDGWVAEWPVAIEAVARANKGLAGVLRDCKPVEADANTVTIGTNGRFHHEQISDPEKRRVIAEALSAIGGRPIEVVTRFTGEERPRGPSGSVSDVTQAVLDTFAGSRVTATRLHDDSRFGTPGTGNGA